MKYGLELTARDLQILSFLKEQGVATSGQLTKQFFVTPEAFRKRISFLIRFGLVEALPLRSHIHGTPSRMEELREGLLANGKMWQKVKIYRLTKTLTGAGKSSDSPLTEPIFWQHQLGLTEVRSHLQAYLKTGIFLSDPESKAEWAKYRFGSEAPIPDLVWRGEREFAIEFERTNKGEMRYFDRMARYSRSHYDRVLYIANTEDIGDVLKKCASRFPKVGVSSRASLNKVYVGINGFQSFEDFLVVDEQPPK